MDYADSNGADRQHLPRFFGMGSGCFVSVAVPAVSLVFARCFLQGSDKLLKFGAGDLVEVLFPEVGQDS